MSIDPIEIKTKIDKLVINYVEGRIGVRQLAQKMSQMDQEEIIAALTADKKTRYLVTILVKSVDAVWEMDLDDFNPERPYSFHQVLRNYYALLKRLPHSDIIYPPPGTKRSFPVQKQYRHFNYPNRLNNTELFSAYGDEFDIFPKIKTKATLKMVHAVITDYLSGLMDVNQFASICLSIVYADDTEHRFIQLDPELDKYIKDWALARSQIKLGNLTETQLKAQIQAYLDSKH